MKTSDKFFAINPSNDNKLEGEFYNATKKEIDNAVLQAKNAFAIYRKKSKQQIAAFLIQIGEEISNLGEALPERCHLETGLPIARLQGERTRTINQLLLFANLVLEGSWVDAKIDTAIPDRNPVAKPDIRQLLIPIGPVAVFGASNFPFAFSTAGGDTASALASGCPVIVKGHEAHPGTSEMVAKAIKRAIDICGMPEGTFSLLQGNSKKVGQELVQHPEIKAVGFTGSFTGGKALFDYANSRPEPIPVFAEMGSTNPVFILPEALQNKTKEIAVGLANSITLGVGQFCTSPGLTFVGKSKDADIFYQELKQKISETMGVTMLTPGIKKNYELKIDKTKSISQVQLLSSGIETTGSNNAIANIFKTSISNYLNNPELSDENFGPSSVIVESDSKQALLEAARNLKGHLTATIFGTPNDLKNNPELLSILELKVGRVIINNFPTGVEVCHSMVHGGPFPATTAPNSTSVGSGAIKRFVRPICFQDYPDDLLPDALKNKNPQKIWRLVNGNFTQDKIES
ncbi:aldehyde dehydrogenase (NADP(+)) [Flavobacterium fluviatile]|uniref:aldehyde dehydrogenase (NADP(+)) n=1 Tax=Flavobacterium fluviatile TaxID=1862387 RepID=UPI0013D40B8A|nr:aldehyde dehydrogenase (NADP(+)) [Flavobacterium fluviatile]